jgi:hypothetical protein
MQLCVATDNTSSKIRLKILEALFIGHAPFGRIPVKLIKFFQYFQFRGQRTSFDVK